MTAHISFSCVSEETAKRVKIRAVNQLHKASSPRVLVTHLGHKFPLLIDEGSELNALDGDYAITNKVSYVPTSLMASAAGNQELHILGQTEEDFVVSCTFANRKIPINSGPAVVIKNLIGCTARQRTW